LQDPRWSKVDALLDEALDRPAGEREAWLARACAGDAALRAEVERLLALSQLEDDALTPAGALSGPFWESVAEELEAGDGHPLRAGERVGPYEIAGVLGRGGMGRVYRARHPTLDRDVALKVLHGAAGSESVQRRLRREARLLASLSHPNVAAVYDLLFVDGRPYLVLELVEGETLGERISRGPLETAELVAVAGHVADALAEAHGSGIVHRDLKPSNVMLGPGGRVKVLDFGLAKTSGEARRGREDADAIATTAPGTVLGTPAYMSPEQARGQSVDQRTDVWAFGCLLYEMLTGRRAFLGETTSDVLAAVLRDPPDWSRIPTDAPPALARLVQACLEKDPERRIADMRAPQAVLRELTRRPGPARPQRRRRLGLAAAGLAAFVAGVIAHRALPRPPRVPRLAKPTQITSAVGREDFPSWSPDGRMLAYAAMPEGTWDVWVVQIGSGPPLNRTRDHAGSDYSPSWAPDGSQIAYRSAREGGGIFLMPPLSGAPRKLVSQKDQASLRASPQWSADASRLAYVVQDEGSTLERLEVLTLRNGETRRYALPGRWACRCEISWSPDGRLIAYVDSQGHDMPISQILVLRLADGSVRPATEGRFSDWSPSFSADGRALYFVSNRGGAMDLWQLPLGGDGAPAGPPRPVTVGVGMQRAAFSPDGERLAYSKGRKIGNVHRVPLHRDRAATWAEAEPLTFDQAWVEFLDVSPDGRRLAFSSDRSGNSDLWVLSLDGGELRQLTDDPTPDWQPAWSPDGREIAFYSYRSGNRDLWVVPAAGGPARQLTRDAATDAAPSWSPDGTRLVFTSDRGGNRDLWVVPAAGGPESRLRAGPAAERFPRWSPDGGWIVFNSYRGGESDLWRLPAAGGEPEPLTRSPANYPVWSRDGRRVYFTLMRGEAEHVFEVGFDGRGERAVAEFAGVRGRLGREALATDGRHLYFVWEQDLGDLWVMEVEGGR
jgi:Tol biopolymer transport system component